MQCACYDVFCRTGAALHIILICSGNRHSFEVYIVARHEVVCCIVDRPNAVIGFEY